MIRAFFKGSPPTEPASVLDPLPAFQSAFNYSSTNLMIADANGRIIYVNPATQKLFENAAEDIRQDIPSFNPHAILGSSMDIYHKDPAKIRAMLATVNDVRQATIVVGGRIFAQKLCPIKDEITKLWALLWNGLIRRIICGKKFSMWPALALPF